MLVAGASQEDMRGRSGIGLISRQILTAILCKFCYACFSGDYPVKPNEVKVKRVGDFVDDGLNGSLESIDGGWVKARNEKEERVGSPI